MEGLNGSDVAIGWALIVAISLACYFGIPFLIGVGARQLRATFEQDRLARELIQEEEDELFRLELLAFAENEHREAQRLAGEAPDDDEATRPDDGERPPLT